MSEELAVIENKFEALSVHRSPATVLEEAQTAAKALTTVINGKKKKVTFNGETYLENEDWGTVARFYGVTARIRTTNYIEYGDVRGFEAVAEAYLVGSGEIVSTAESMCLNDEPNWAKKPLFQLRSMAQTRASSRVLRQVFGWVVVLAGYKTTPAEEMEGVDGQAVRQPSRSSNRQQTQRQPAKESVKCASCGATDSHLPSCKYHPKNQSGTGQTAPAPQQSAPVQGEVMPKDAKKETEVPKSTTQESFFVKTCNKKKSGRGGDYLELIGTDESNNDGWRYVWHGHLQKEPADLSTSVGKLCVWDISGTKKGDKIYFSVEKIHSIGTQAYIDDKPAQSPSAADVGFEPQQGNEDIPW